MRPTKSKGPENENARLEFFNDNFQVRDVQESPFIIRPLLFTNSALGRWQIADTTREVACAPLPFTRIVQRFVSVSIRKHLDNWRRRCNLFSEIRRYFG